MAGKFSWRCVLSHVLYNSAQVDSDIWLINKEKVTSCSVNKHNRPNFLKQSSQNENVILENYQILYWFVYTPVRVFEKGKFYPINCPLLLYSVVYLPVPLPAPFVPCSNGIRSVCLPRENVSFKNVVKWTSNLYHSANRLSNLNRNKPQWTKLK